VTDEINISDIGVGETVDSVTMVGEDDREAFVRVPFWVASDRIGELTEESILTELTTEGVVLLYN
jgi:hypothetical protein